VHCTSNNHKKEVITDLFFLFPSASALPLALTSSFFHSIPRNSIYSFFHVVVPMVY
jgi:hypothetical protein